MSNNLPDIDIDVLDRSIILAGLNYVPASMAMDGDLKKHPTGVFFQSIPVDPKTGLAVFPSGKKSGDISDEKGFFKVDFINNAAYQHVKNLAHMDELLTKPINWHVFGDPNVVAKLQHIGNHYEIISYYPPTCIMDLAILIALIRPAKRYLIGSDWVTISNNIWKVENDGYRFKKSHAVSYAQMIIVQLHSLQDIGVLS
jgi:hypothetical protein